MIKSFADKETEKIASGKFSRRIPMEIQERAYRKLIRIHSATCIDELRRFPSDRLELLEPRSRGEYSIRINDQWRIVFNFIESNAYDVRIVDYH